jgi:hypothetical protein
MFGTGGMTLTNFTEQLIATLEEEIKEREAIIAKLKGGQRTMRPAPVRKATSKPKGTRWSKERLRQFRATMAAKKKAAPKA